MNYFEMIAIVSLFCLGLRAITDNGMIGYPIRKYFLDRMSYWGKPIVLCATCMSSFWGTIIYWGYELSNNQIVYAGNIVEWLGIAISSAFVNAIFWEYYQKAMRK